MGDGENTKVQITVGKGNAHLMIFMKDRDLIHLIQRVTFTDEKIMCDRITFMRATVDGGRPTVLEAAKKWAEDTDSRITFIV